MKRKFNGLPYLVLCREVGSSEVFTFRVRVSCTRSGISSIVLECEKRGLVFLGVVHVSYANNFYKTLKDLLYGQKECNV